jgi:hypothetical protein
LLQKRLTVQSEHRNLLKNFKNTSNTRRKHCLLQKALEMLEWQSTGNLLNNSNLFTRLIFDNCILSNGTICEVHASFIGLVVIQTPHNLCLFKLTGPPGSGKTQFAFQLCVQLYLNNYKDTDSFSIFYIDTENTFSAERYQMTLFQLTNRKKLQFSCIYEVISDSRKSVPKYDRPSRLSQQDDEMRLRL